uniref:Uncharacterized protein n=1 Tax=Anguilla anguilla TaxID=7936 RepID=A0A0E9TUS0_ANGAN
MAVAERSVAVKRNCPRCETWCGGVVLWFGNVWLPQVLVHLSSLMM